MRQRTLLLMAAMGVLTACENRRESEATTSYSCFEAKGKKFFSIGTAVGAALPLGQPYAGRPQNYIPGTVVGHQRRWEFLSEKSPWIRDGIPADTSPRPGYIVWDPCTTAWPKGKKTTVAFADPVILLKDSATAMPSSKIPTIVFTIDSTQDQRIYAEFDLLIQRMDSNVVRGGGQSRFPK